MRCPDLALGRRYLASASEVANAVYGVVVVLRSRVRPRDLQERHHVADIFAGQRRAILGRDVSVPICGDDGEVSVFVAVRGGPVPADQFARLVDEVHRLQSVFLQYISPGLPQGCSGSNNSKPCRRKLAAEYSL